MCIVSDNDRSVPSRRMAETGAGKSSLINALLGGAHHDVFPYELQKPAFTIRDRKHRSYQRDGRYVSCILHGLVSK